MPKDQVVEHRDNQSIDSAENDDELVKSHFSLDHTTDQTISKDHPDNDSLVWGNESSKKDHQSIDSDNDSFVWEDDLLEDDDMITHDEEELDLGDSCFDFNWDQRTTLSGASIRFDLHDRDEVSALVDLDERSSDSTVLSLPSGDWFSLDTEISVACSEKAYSDTTRDAIRLEKREQRRSKVMAKMMRLEVSMQKMGIDIGYSNDSSAE